MAYQFSNNWFYTVVRYWPNLFRVINWTLPENTPKTILEIGSFEGQSTCWILNNLANHPDSRVICVDPFTGSIEHSSEQTEGLFDRFQSNIALTGRSQQVEIYQGFSQEKLPILFTQGYEFDFCYIDGSHKAADVLFDAVLSWQMLRSGGLIIFDDYLWPSYQNQPLLNPKLGIDAFVNCHLDQLRYFGGAMGTQQAFIKR